jgi:hypothetical protein
MLDITAGTDMFAAGSQYPALFGTVIGDPLEPVTAITAAATGIPIPLAFTPIGRNATVRIADITKCKCLDAHNGSPPCTLELWL